MNQEKMIAPTGVRILAPAAFHVMLKPRGAICNLNCAYCYYPSKERLYPDSRLRMANELLEKFTCQYIETEVTLGWQGGKQANIMS